MKITDPGKILERIDVNRLHELLGPRNGASSSRKKLPRKSTLTYVHPSSKEQDAKPSQSQTISHKTSEKSSTSSPVNGQFKTYRGKVNLLGDYVDTDAVRYSTFPSQQMRLLTAFIVACSSSIPHILYNKRSHWGTLSRVYPPRVP